MVMVNIKMIVPMYRMYAFKRESVLYTNRFIDCGDLELSIVTSLLVLEETMVAQFLYSGFVKQ